jgi:UDP-N-acetylglucosamine 2-epimerase
MVKDGAGKVRELIVRTAAEDSLDTHEPKKVMVVIGTRPEAIKLAPVVLELERHRAHFKTQICVTGQHREMLNQILRVSAYDPTTI